jgi:hypothetical protein
MKHHIETTRRQLGELAAMSHQTQAVERQILERAEAHLKKVQADIETTRPLALAAGAVDADRYQELIMERGRLRQVIAQARVHLT